MDTLFTERHAIETAFNNLQDEKKQRREELRTDLEKIDDRQFYVLDRLAVLDAKTDMDMGMVFERMNVIENEFRERMDQTVDTIVKTAEKLARPTVPAPDPIEAPIQEAKPLRVSELVQAATQVGVKADKPKRTYNTKAKKEAASIRKEAAAKIAQPKKRETPTSTENGVDMVIGILKEAGTGVRPAYIAEKLKENHGKEYANVHGQLKTWMDASGGKIRKNGSSYELATEAATSKN